MDESYEGIGFTDEEVSLSEEEINEILGIAGEAVSAEADDKTDEGRETADEDENTEQKVAFKKRVTKKTSKPEKKGEISEDPAEEPANIRKGTSQSKESKEEKGEEDGRCDEESKGAVYQEDKGNNEKEISLHHEDQKGGGARPDSPSIDFETSHAYEDYSEQMGELTLRAVKKEDDSTLSQGVREMRNSEMLFMAKALLQNTGGASLYKDLRVNDERQKNACIKAETLIKEKKITYSDLGSEERLRKKLTELASCKEEGILSTDIAEIEKYREEIIRKFRTKSELLAKEGLLTNPEKEWIKSEKFYKSSSSPRFGAILEKYFEKEGVEFSKNLKISALRADDIKPLIKKYERGGTSRQIHIDLLKDYEKRLKKRELRLRIYGRGIAQKKPARLLGHMTTLAMSSNGDIGHFIHKTRIFLTSAEIAKRAFSVSDGYIRKHSVLGKTTQKLFEASKKHIFEAAKKTRFVKAAQTAGRTLSFTAKQTARFAAGKTGEILHIKTIRKGIKTAVNTAFDTKPARFAKKVVKKSVKKGKTIKTAYQKIAHVVSTPVRAIGKVADLLRRLNLKVLGVIGGVVLTLFKLYNVLLVMVMLLLSIDSLIISAMEGTGQMVSSYVDMLRSVINYEDYSDMESDIDYMLVRDRERLTRARQIGEGEPENTNVTCGETIDRYGSPDNPKGYTITVTDPLGIELPENTSNARDIEALCIAMISNDLGMYKGYRRDKKMLDDLIADMYALLAENIIVEESDIYFCSSGCRNFYYHCNSTDDYNGYYDIYANGGACYSHLLTLKDEDYGCRSHLVWDYHDHRYESEYYCPGDHGARVCFGHKDARITITLYGLEYAISHNIYPRDWRNKSYALMIKEFVERGAWTNSQFSEYARRYYSGNWDELYGIDLDGGVGFSSTDPLSYEDIEEMLSMLPADVSKKRKDIVAFALEAVGKVGYQWGGKASGIGWSARFGSSAPDDKGRANGLDCSGFVQWVYRSAINKSLPGSTAGFGGYPRVQREDLEAGDLGFYNIPGSEENHIGIYAGKDATGNDVWVHCAGATGSTYGTGNFKYFVKLID